MSDDDAITVQQAAAEYVRRRRARESLVDYSLAIDIPGAPVAGSPEDGSAFRSIETSVAPHHRLIMHAIQRALTTPSSYLMILAPPGSAKSSYASVVSPTWIMGKVPGYRTILASYASTIAYKQSRRARQICRQNRYANMWPQETRLLDEQRAVDEWSLTNGSELMAAGLLAGITGNRANCAIIDDPVANREQAESPSLRSKIYDEYTDTVQTRLLPGGCVILIMTRWHELDLAGEILPEDYDGESGMIKCRDNHTWNVICIPAEAERADDPLGRKPGQFLWPEWFPREHWSTWRDNPRTQRTWSAMFQQRPTPATGIQFHRDMFRWYDPDVPRGSENGLPEHLSMFGASDYATLEERGDFTEHGIAGMSARGHMYFVDWWSGQRETNVTIDRFIYLLRAWQPRLWANEGGVIDKAIRPAINRRMTETQAFVAIMCLTSIADKSVKLQSFHARAAARTVWLPLKRAWAQQVVDQLVKFPAGRYDDKADVCGLLGRLVDKMPDARLPIAEQEDILKPFTGRWVEWTESHRKPRVRYF